jgi:hypothetical protein
MSTPADRQRTYRQRQRAGKTVLPIIIDLAEVEYMLERGHLLPAGYEHSRDAVTIAIEQQLRILCRLP